jgi:ABC-type Fe3+ transport system permease subunit
MDLWHALGVSREAALLAAAVGVLVALVLAGGIALRRRGHERDGGLRIDDR